MDQASILCPVKKVLVPVDAKIDIPIAALQEKGILPVQSGVLENCPACAGSHEWRSTELVYGNGRSRS